MAKIKVSERQNLIDLAVQLAGSAISVFDVAKENGLNPTDKLEPGQTIEVSSVVNTDRVNYLKAKGIKPATDEQQLPDEYDRLFSEEFFEEFE